MKLKLTPTQNLCVGFLESGFKVMQINDNYYFVKGKRQQKVLSKTLDALIKRGAAQYSDSGEYQLSDEFVAHRQQMRYSTAKDRQAEDKTNDSQPHQIH